MAEISPNPFTPKSGWEPKVFAGREAEIEFFKKKLAEAKEGICDHFLVLGDWGIGKTSLLKEFKKIAQEDGILTSYFPIREFQKTDRFVQASEQLIKEIPRGLPIKHEKLKNFVGYLRGLGITLPVIGGGIQIPSRDIGLVGDPQVLLLEGLINIWMDVKKESDVVVVLLDDVQNYSALSGYLTILKNVLSYDEIIDTGFLFVLACTPDMWKQFLALHHPIGRYFTPRLSLERLNEKETDKVVINALKDTGVEFDNSIKQKIFEYTTGHPYELQILCSKLYENQIKGRVTEDVWEHSLNDTLMELGEIVFERLYEKASKNEQKVLYLISLVDKQVSPQELINFSNDILGDIPPTVINTGLQRLFKKGLVIKPEKYKYSLSDRMFREYVIRLKEINDFPDKIQDIQKTP